MSVIIDIILVAILALQIFFGWRRGLTGVVLGFARIILSFVLALILGPVMGDLIGDGGFLSRVLAYICVFILTFVCATIVMYLLKSIKIPVISTLDKLLGILIGFALGMITVSMIAVMLNSLLSALTWLTSDNSYIAVYDDSYVFKFVNEFNIFGFIKDILM